MFSVRESGQTTILWLCRSWNELFFVGVVVIVHTLYIYIWHTLINLPCKSLCKQKLYFIRFNEMHHRFCSNNFAKLMNTDFVRFPYTHTLHSTHYTHKRTEKSQSFRKQWFSVLKLLNKKTNRNNVRFFVLSLKLFPSLICSSIVHANASR